MCRAYRWRLQLRAISVNPPMHALIYSIFGTYSVNLVFRASAKVWRTGYIAQRQKAPFTTVFGSMVADRLAPTVTVFTFWHATFLVGVEDHPGLPARKPVWKVTAAIARLFDRPGFGARRAAAIAALWISP